MSGNLLIFAGKTTSLYKMAPEQYKTILTKTVSKKTRKAEPSTQLKIDKEAKIFSKTCLHFFKMPQEIFLK